jgi:uncharacterized protein (PEP-CTERM system associated)
MPHRYTIMCHRDGAGAMGGRLALLVLLGCATGLAWAQTVVVTPSVSVQETYTTNRDVSASNPQSDLITQVTPTVTMSSRSGALQGNLNYSLTGVGYARDSSQNSIYHTLSSNATLNLLDGRAGMQVSASAARQVVSAFGVQVSDPALNAQNNMAQTFTYSLAPYVSGMTVGDVRYKGQVVYGESKTDSGGLGNTANGSAQLSLSRQFGILGIGLDASRTIYDSANFARTHIGQVGLSVQYRPDIEWQLSARAGFEVSDMLGVQSERVSTWGIGTVWQPTPRTMVRLDYDHRFFGQAHSVLLTHRTARTIWTYVDTRSVDVGGATGRAVISNYDLYMAQFASIYPDPVDRDREVRDFMAKNGIGLGSQTVLGGFLSNGPLLQRSQQLSVAYQGLRQTLTFSWSRTLSTGLGASNSIANGVGSVDQQGFDVVWSYRLTNDSSLVLSAGSQRTASAGALYGGGLRSLQAMWTVRLGPRTNASLALRHNAYDSDANPYSESAIVGAVRLGF